jgi:hypothetical protein
VEEAMQKLLILGLAAIPGLCAGAEVTVNLEGAELVPVMTLRGSGESWR